MLGAQPQTLADDGGAPTALTGRRRPAIGAEQDRRKAWGQQWGSVTSTLAKQLDGGQSK